VNPELKVPLWPSGFVTTTFTAPEAWAGVTAVIVVPLTTFMFVAAFPPMVTVAPETKFEPEIVTAVPPPVPPLLGEIDETLGAPPPPPPLDFGKIVVSFLSVPGGKFKKVPGDSTIWSMDSPSSLGCILIVCVPLVAK